MAQEEDDYRVQMDGRWSLNDLYQFPHEYSQTYAFAYCFETRLDPRDSDRIDWALESYPFRGGHSIVNLYRVLESQVPPKQRPRIISIRYASPGWIDLALNLEAAVSVAKSVALIAASMVVTTKCYAALQRTLQGIREQRERSKTQLLRISSEQAAALRRLCNELAKLIGMKSFEELLRRTGDVEDAAKILAAQFRRLKAIAEFQNKGKLTLPEVTHDQMKSRK